MKINIELMGTFNPHILASLPTDLTHPKALLSDPTGRLFAGCASHSGGIISWAPDGSGGFTKDWQLPLGRVLGLGRFSDGTILASVRQGNISRIEHLTVHGKSLGSWGVPGADPGQLSNPQNLAITSDDCVCMVEATAWDGSRAWETNRVQIFSASGSLKACWGEYGTEPGQLNLPIGIAAAPDGNLWVADSFNSRIQQFSQEGKLLSSWGKLGRQPGCLNVPQGISLLPDQTLLVADTHNDRIQCFSREGLLLWSWGNGRGSDSDQLWLPCAVTTDNLGRILIADTMNHRIQIVEPKS